jgi:Pyrimidine dimer DNA glycosylase
MPVVAYNPRSSGSYPTYATSGSISSFCTMRLWSLHPSLLDRIGLVALWREALLAQAVLLGQTKGYRNHPQLDRFRECSSPDAAIAAYLWAIHDEAQRRGYDFDASKIARRRRSLSIRLTRGQVQYELAHLKRKLRHRDPTRLRHLEQLARITPHPLFKVVPGEIATWERGQKLRKSR